MDYSFIDIFLKTDKVLPDLIVNYQNWIYLILFLIIFIETGLVFMPFLPGDSLLFAAGITWATNDSLNIYALTIILITAAILGDTLNYQIAKFLGPKILTNEKLIKQEYIDETQNYFDKYGGITIIIARFMPFVRTFAPFVAGLGKMNYGKFIVFNVIGAFLWVTLILWAGYFFGNIQIVKDNFKLVTLGIIFISVLPIFIKFAKSKFSK